MMGRTASSSARSFGEPEFIMVYYEWSGMLIAG